METESTKLKQETKNKIDLSIEKIKDELCNHLETKRKNLHAEVDQTFEAYLKYAEKNYKNIIY